MSMLHKAYVFAYDAFAAQLRPILVGALADGHVEPLRRFIEANWDRLTDPVEGEPLDDDWESRVDPKDAHQYGDVALTLFYDPLAEVGLDHEWMRLSDRFEAAGLGSGLILGEPVGAAGRAFDPGKMGSYLQPPALVRRHRRLIDEARDDLGAWVEPAHAMLRRADGAGQGLYVTF